MYGLVNKGLQDWVCSAFGDAVWQRILTKAGVGHPSFVSMRSYPDDVTVRLVHATSDILNRPPADIMESFGEHWTVYTAKEGYGDYLRMTGSCFADVLQNLDNLHARVALAFPNLTPPSFHSEEVEAGVYRVHYYSSRQGLAPFVVGLLRGLAKVFATTADIRHVVVKGDGHDHDEFLVRTQRAE